MLSTIAVLGYVGWSIYSLSVLLLGANSISPLSKGTVLGVNACSGTILGCAFVAFAVQREPVTYYIYVAFTVGLWRTIILRVWCAWKNFNSRVGSRDERARSWGVYLNGVVGVALPL